MVNVLAYLFEGLFRRKGSGFHLQVVHGLRRDDDELQGLAECSKSRTKVSLSVGRVGFVPAHMDPSQADLQAAVVFMAELESTGNRTFRVIVQPKVVFQMC